MGPGWAAVGDEAAVEVVAAAAAVVVTVVVAAYVVLFSLLSISISQSKLFRNKGKGKTLVALLIILVEQRKTTRTLLIYSAR